MTPAEELRAAAKKIRAICAGVQATPWTEDDNAMSWQLRGGVVGEFQLIKAPKKASTQAEYWPNWAERQHILMWQPDTALLVAVLLDRAAEDWDEIDQNNRWLDDLDSKREYYTPSSLMEDALAIARMLNGEVAA